MARPSSSQRESAQQKADRDKLVATVSAVVAAALAKKFADDQTKRALVLANISVDAIIATIVRTYAATTAVLHTAVNTYAHVLTNASDENVAGMTAYENAFQVKYGEKAAERIAAKVAKAVTVAAAKKDATPESIRAAYTDAVNTATEYEARMFDVRMDASAQRMHEKVSEQKVRVDSPQGAYWLLDPTKKVHTEDCIAMAGHAWSWDALRVVSPSNRHFGCGCHLISLHMAKAGGYANADRILTKLPAVALHPDH